MIDLDEEVLPGMLVKFMAGVHIADGQLTWVVTAVDRGAVGLAQVGNPEKVCATRRGLLDFYIPRTWAERRRRARQALALLPKAHTKETDRQSVVLTEHFGLRQDPALRGRLTRAWGFPNRKAELAMTRWGVFDYLRNKLENTPNYSLNPTA